MRKTAEEQNLSPTAEARRARAVYQAWKSVARAPFGRGDPLMSDLLALPMAFVTPCLPLREFSCSED